MNPKILITSGPTREFIDPVRFLSNASSGIMGSELARTAVSRGLSVTVISGPVEISYPKKARLIRTVSAKEMFNAAKKNLGSADIVIGAAAVADYRPASYSIHKIKKQGQRLNLRLSRNPDIIKFIGKNKRGRVVVGFALETKNLIASARKKLREKNLDLIVANSDAAVGNKYSKAFLIDRSGTVTAFKRADKRKIAERIIDESIRIWKDS